jgi:hypothetical protein
VASGGFAMSLWERGSCLAVILVAALGCGEKDRRTGWVENAGQTSRETPAPVRQTRQVQGASPDAIQKVTKPDVPLAKLKEMKFTLPAGWTAQFDNNTNEWFLDKQADKQLTRVRVVRAPVQNEPNSADAYYQFLQQPDEAGYVWPQLIQSGSVGDGFFLIAKCRLSSDQINPHPDVGFVVIRNLGNDRFRFKCHNVHNNDTLREEAMSICRTARF